MPDLHSGIKFERLKVVKLKIFPPKVFLEESNDQNIYK